MKNEAFSLDIVILAGGPLSVLEEDSPPIHRSLIPIHGKTVLEYMIEAVRKAGICKQLILIGSEAITASPYASMADQYISVPESSKLSDNFRKSTRQSTASHIMIMGGDIPGINATILAKLYELIQEYRDKDLLAFVVTRESVEASFPGSHRTYGKIKEGRAKVGNALVLRQEALDKLDPLIDKFTKNRKSVIKLAFSFGIINIIKMAIFKNISIPQLEKAFKKSTGIDAKGILTPYGELAVDIDKSSDITDMENYFGRNA
jgi:CTP:molybdopterin cytidylyltransferase MocA